MHCRKVRLSLEQNEPLEGELREHLDTCPACAEWARTQEILNGSLTAVRAAGFADPTPLSVVRAKLAVHAHQEEDSIMAKLANALLGHKRLSLGIAFGIAALIIFVAVPFPYERTVGYNVSVAGLPAEIPNEALQTGLGAIGQANAEVKILASNGGTAYHVLNLPNLEAAKAVVSAITALSGIEVDARINPIVEMVSASLYAQAKERVVRIEVDGKGKTDEQIKAEIEVKLAAQGLSPAFIFVKSDSTGQRNIRLEIAEKGDSMPRGQQTTIEIDGRGKTDAEIEAEVKAKLAEQGRPNANVTVERSGPDSLREIKIEIEDTTGQ
jgi:hypothetical protein